MVFDRFCGREVPLGIRASARSIGAAEAAYGLGASDYVSFCLRVLLPVLTGLYLGESGVLCIRDQVLVATAGVGVGVLYFPRKAGWVGSFAVVEVACSPVLFGVVVWSYLHSRWDLLMAWSHARLRWVVSGCYELLGAGLVLGVPIVGTEKYEFQRVGGRLYVLREGVRWGKVELAEETNLCSKRPGQRRVFSKPGVLQGLWASSASGKLVKKIGSGPGLTQRVGL